MYWQTYFVWNNTQHMQNPSSKAQYVLKKHENSYRRIVKQTSGNVQWKNINISYRMVKKKMEKKLRAEVQWAFPVSIGDRAIDCIYPRAFIAPFVSGCGTLSSRILRRCVRNGRQEEEQVSALFPDPYLGP